MTEMTPAQRVDQIIEFERVFDLMDATDASEWFYGHDCEVTQ